MICPTCFLGQISPETHRCELCGFDPAATDTGDARNAVAVDSLARAELAERLHLDACLSRVANTAVYLAREPGSGRAIVVKLLQRPEEGRAEADERFRSAATAVAALKRRHAVRVLGSGSTDHFYWYSMEPVRELSLRSVLRELGAALRDLWQWLVVWVSRTPARWRMVRRAAARSLRRLALALRARGVTAQLWMIASTRRARARWRAAQLAGGRALRNAAIAAGRGVENAAQRIVLWWGRVVEWWRAAWRVAGPALRRAVLLLGDLVRTARRGTVQALDRVRRRDAVRVVAATAAGVGGAPGVAGREGRPGEAPGGGGRGMEPRLPERGGAEAAPALSVDALAHAELAGQFAIGECVSAGATTAVYLASEIGSGHPVVVKILLRPAPGRAEDEDRFRSVAAAAAAVERARASGWTEHLYWYATEPEHVGRLRKAIRALVPVVNDVRQRVAAQLARVLDLVRRRQAIRIISASRDDEAAGPDEAGPDAAWGGAGERAPGAAASVTDHPDAGWKRGAGREAPTGGWTPQPPWEPRPPSEPVGAGVAQSDGDAGPVAGITDERGGAAGVAEQCPNCLVGEISPVTHRCGLCGRDPKEVVAARAPRVGALDALAREELAEQFRLDEALGFGETTAVYLARAQGSDRQVAVKVLPRPSEGRIDTDERFGRAVESVAELVHPQVVPVLEHGWTEHLYWYSMGHVRGRSLRSVLLERGPLDLKTCLRITTQVAGALDYAHRRGVVHGAVKPENVLMDEDGWIHVCDLLVTRALEPPNPVGPPAAPASAANLPLLPPGPSEERDLPYSAPEGLSTPSADQYALAVLVAECLTGTPLAAPPRGAEAGRPAALPSGVPPHVRHALERALSERPVDRFGGVLDFVAALERYTALSPEMQSAGGSTVVLRQTDWKPPGHPVRRRLVGVGVVALLAALGAWKGPAAVRAVRGFFSPAQPLSVVPFVTDNPEQAVPKPRPEDLRPLPASPAPETAKPGLLFVNATPWGQLYVDGQLIGNTPKGNIVLDAGAHTVRVLREGYEAYDRTVQIVAGQALRLTDITLVQRP